MKLQIVGALFVACAVSSPAAAQELEPRAHRSLPKGLSFFFVSASRLDGNVAGDPTAPIQDLDAELDALSVGYLRTFSLFGRSASLFALQSFAEISGEATLRGERVSARRSGAQDLRLKLNVNVVGAPAAGPAEFSSSAQRRQVGASLTVTAPTGDYDGTRLINFGTNRWGFKPEVGYSTLRGRWTLEGSLGAWLFSDNPEFLGRRREQDPIGNVQAHASRALGKTVLSLSANYFWGGRTTLERVRNPDPLYASRIGAGLSVPFSPSQALVVNLSQTAFEKRAADYGAVTATYRLRWNP